MIAVVPVRAGIPPAGAAETVAEAGGRVIVVGDGVEGALGAIGPWCEAVLAETGAFAPARTALLLAGELAGEDVVVLPASPDGRDLAPRIAATLGRPLLAGAVEVGPGRVVVSGYGGRVADEYAPEGPFVATLEPGARGDDPGAPVPPGSTVLRRLPAAAAADGAGPASRPTVDPEVVEVTPPDPSSMDLAEAPRIVAGGAGLGGASSFALLGSVATALGASMGATRVVTDAGLVAHERQIGTTGVAVHPDVYIALGISGAVQHTGGLGRPEHIIAVNVDPSCPMMAMADVAIVADAAAVLDRLADELGVRVDPSAPDAGRDG